VLLTLDTLRADHLSAIGGGPQSTRTPALDALAARGAFYTRGIAHVPLTLPSHLTMLSGLPPDATGLVRNGQPVRAELPLVPEAFAAAGWRTGAFVSAGVLARRTGISRGFAHYDDQLGPLHRALQSGLLHGIFRLTEPTRPPSQRRGDETLARALAWLATPDARPAFLWVHLYDPHAPYDPPAPYRARVAEAAEDPEAPGRPEDMRALHRRLRARQRMPFLGVGMDLRAPIAAYAGEVEWTDHLVSRLVAALPEDATLVVAADHGESLLEHDYPLNHGNRLHEVALRVPILHVGPGVAPARVDTPVPLSSLASTLLAAAGLPAFPGAAPGLPSPAAANSGEILSVAPVQQSRRTFGQRGQPRVGWTAGPLRVIVDDDDTLTAFDLSADPAESTDVGASLPDAGARRAAGRTLLDTLPLRKDDVPAGDEDLVEELRALGYTE
jgi:arylsulfatase A-like enzyme